MRPLPVLLLLVLVALAQDALGHAGGAETLETRVTMPVWVPWLAGGLVVALSFLIVGVFMGREPATGHGRPLPRVDPLVAPARIGVGNFVGLLVLALIVLAAFVPGHPAFPSAVVWTLVWAGLAATAYLVGDVWPKVSPFAVLARAVERLRGVRKPLPYPRALGAWPAVALLLLIIGLEVSRTLGHGAPALGRAALAYTLFTMLGMALFGGAVWLRDVEVFGRTFRWWAACSPLRREEGRLTLGLPAARLDALAHLGLADVAFTVGLLYGVNHDALANGPPGAALATALSGHVPDAVGPLVLLVGGFLLFLAVFLLCASRMRRASETALSTVQVAATFAAALVPIAVGYHLAHHVPLFLEQGPSVAAAVLDPFGTRGTGAGAVRLGAATLTFLGYLQVTFILVGHIIAVVAAHRLAVRVFPGRLQALRAEVPLTLVMVLYTLVGLWLASGASLGGGAA